MKKNYLRMSSNKVRPRCGFIPPHILEKLAESRAEGSLESVQQSVLAREKRAAKTKEVSIASALEGVAISKKGVTARRGRPADIKVYDSENKWRKRVRLMQPSSTDSAVKAAFKSSKQVQKYIKDEFNRNSIDNNGMDIITNVHYGVNYNNAFWDGDEMTFGDGDGVIFANIINSPEVVAHELAHGITQFTAGLEYYSQSGALNEHFSDVIGSAFTQKIKRQNAGNADWLIGDEIMGPQLFGEALRSMKAPGLAYDNNLIGKDPQPDHMKDYFTGRQDNQGVHINSGIPNKAFYLTACDIGTQEAMLIWYDALLNLWSTANFNDAVAVIVYSARVLTRDRVVRPGATQSVRSAFKQVGLPV
jgi:Zn-dependent metalloprotease